MNLWAYARVSTEDQHVKQQGQYLVAWIPKNDHVLKGLVVDEESGRLPLRERKKFQRLLNVMREDDSDGMVVFNLDRLTRNWDDVTQIEAYFRDHWTTKKLLSTAESVELGNASGRLMFRVKMAVSCHMPEDMREKQIIGIERAKKEGKYKYGRGRPKHLGRGLQSADKT